MIGCKIPIILSLSLTQWFQIVLRAILINRIPFRNRHFFLINFKGIILLKKQVSKTNFINVLIFQKSISFFQRTIILQEINLLFKDYRINHSKSEISLLQKNFAFDKKCISFVYYNCFSIWKSFHSIEKSFFQAYWNFFFATKWSVYWQ